MTKPRHFSGDFKIWRWNTERCGCPGCDIDIQRADEYDYAVYRKYKSLEQKDELVTNGGKKRRHELNPFRSLKVNELREELRRRAVDDSGLKPDLQARLTDILGGTSRVPALLYGTSMTLSQLNLQDYEVLFFEPLHICLNHIAHIIEELPHHLTDVRALLALKETTSITLGKDKLRCTDYRRAILQITLQFAKLEDMTIEVQELLTTFCEMIGIFYADEDKHTPKQVLRLYNLSFRHWQLLLF